MKHSIVSFAQIAAGFCAISALSACTRTYDGSVVPEYTAYRVADGWAPHYVYRKTDTQPRSRLIKFPPAPPAVEAETDVAAAPVRPAKRRQVQRQPVAAKTATASPTRKVSCRRDNSDAGRIRVVCD